MQLDQEKIEMAQDAVCRQYGATFAQTSPDDKIGFASSTEGLLPINGLRHPQSEETSGWYIWCGESFSAGADFFQPLHAIHFYERHPEFAQLLGLPSGWRFLSSGDYLDVWFDESLLSV